MMTNIIQRMRNDVATIDKRELADKTMKDNREKNDELTKVRRSRADQAMKQSRLRNDEITVNRREINSLLMDN